MKNKLNKYWHIFQIAWQESLEYRAELFLWAFIETMPLVAMIILWLSIYRQNQTIADFSQANMIQYYMAGFLINRITNVNIELSYINEIKTGGIARFFLKPFSLKRLMILNELSWRSLNVFLIVIPTVIAISLFAPSYLPHTNVIQVSILTLLIIIAFAINSLISLLIMGLSFFLDQGKALVHLKWMLEGVFSGSLLPLAAYPQYLDKIAQILPFRYKFSIPVEYYIGKLSYPELVTAIIVSMIWIIGLYTAIRIIWHFAIRKFTAVGN